MMRRIIWILVALLLLVVGAAWWWMQNRQPELEPVAGVSEETAQIAERKLQLLVDGATDSVALSGAEITSVIRYRSPAWVRNTVVSPAVHLDGDTLRVSGLLPTDRLPSDPRIDQMKVMLPDSARLDVTGVLLVLEDGEMALELADLQLAGIPIPRRFYPEIVDRLNQPETEGLPETAVLLPLPAGVSEVRIRDSLLILIPEID